MKPTESPPDDFFTLRCYRYGFICFKKFAVVDTQLIDFWKRLEINDYVIFVHPETAVHKVISENATAVFLGDVFVCAGDQTIDELTLDFLNNESWNALDHLSGRFTLLIFNTNGGKVLHDPIGSRSIFYRLTGDFCVGSHAALVAALFGDKVNETTSRFIRSPEYDQRGTSYLPGDLTRFENIVGLIPNNYYDIAARQTWRYWPRHEVEPTQTKFFLAASDAYFSRFASFLRDRYSPVLGLTGGVDSRAMIAALRHYNLDCRLVTWAGKWLSEEETQTVDKLARYLRYDHEYLDYSKNKGADNWTAYCQLSRLNKGEDWTASSSDIEKSLAAAMRQITHPRDVFVRGWGGEILRGFYNIHNTRRRIDQHNPNHLAKLYLTNRVRNPDPFFYRFTVQAFEKFIQRANYDQDFYLLDPQDLFYWEQRMGIWAASMLNAMDPAMYSMIGMNSRKLFKAAFGLSPEKRNTPELLIKIIAYYDKKLAAIGNPNARAKSRTTIYQKSARSIKFKRPKIVDEKVWANLTDAAHVERMALLLTVVYGKQVLEIGSGSGILGALLLKKKPISRYYGTDIQQQTTLQSRDTVVANCSNSHKARFCTTNGYEMAFRDRSFDTVLCVEVLEHVHEPQRIVREIYRLLVPNGNAIVAVPIEGLMPPGKTKGHVQDFSIEDIWQILENAGLKVYQHIQVVSWNFYFAVKITPDHSLKPRGHDKRTITNVFNKLPPRLQTIIKKGLAFLRIKPSQIKSLFERQR